MACRHTRGGSRGRVQGVHTPPWDNLRFSNTTRILQKKNYVVYWCWSRTRDGVHPLLKKCWIRPCILNLFLKLLHWRPKQVFWKAWLFHSIFKFTSTQSFKSLVNQKSEPLGPVGGGGVKRTRRTPPPHGPARYTWVLSVQVSTTDLRRRGGCLSKRAESVV